MSYCVENIRSENRHCELGPKEPKRSNLRDSGFFPFGARQIATAPRASQ